MHLLRVDAHAEFRSFAHWLNPSGQRQPVDEVGQSARGLHAGVPLLIKAGLHIPGLRPMARERRVALQAAWASRQPRHGLPEHVVPLEGRIASA